MILADQKTKSYGKANDEVIKKAIQLESSLGYEVLQTQKAPEGISITYKRIEDLKYTYRLKDLEKKILKVDGILSTVRQDQNEFKMNSLNAFGYTKKVLWAALFMAILFDLLFIFQLVVGIESGFMTHFGIISLFFVIALGLHALHYFGLKYIKRKVSDERFIEAIGKLEELRNSFYLKANQISKEIK